MDEYDPNRLPLIKEFVGAIGERYYFQSPIQFNYGAHTFIGDNCVANFNLLVMDDGRVFIGDNVTVLGGVTIGDSAVVGAGNPDPLGGRTRQVCKNEEKDGESRPFFAD